MGYDSRSEHLSHTDIVLAGATSSFITRATCQPLDVLKIRFQLQVEPVSANSPLSKYKSIAQAAGLIVREEGVSALWKGHVPAQLLSIVYGAVQFWAFETLSREAYALGFYERYKPVTHFACGALSGWLFKSFAKIKLRFKSVIFILIKSLIKIKEKMKNFYLLLNKLNTYIVKHILIN